jgi:hypothetical protein
MLVFSGNKNLLIAAPMLQDSFVDKDGSPMSGGTITCYHDNSRTTLKNWYYQVGSGGTYIYIALPNPLTLSAAGTICDINGVDTIPFFYPYDETDVSQIPESDPYYITIVNHEQTNQITRENFPFVPPLGAGPSETVNSFNNLIINNGFWRNVAQNATNITPYISFSYDSTTLAIPPGGTNYTAIVAPSQHDGFRMPDIEYQQAVLTGTNSVTFTPFPLGSTQPIANTNSPEYYISHVCSGAGTGQTQKCYQFPISLHLNTIANQPFTFSIQAQNGGGTSPGANEISIYLLQDTGTGGTPVAPILMTTISLNTSWQQYTFTDFFPATSGLNLGVGADDAWYLQVQMPLNSLCTINFTKPSIYLTQNALPTNDFQTYDQVDAVINSPRTGDIRTSLNRYYYYGWVPMNDGTIGSAASNATCRPNIDAWRLFNLLWQNFSSLAVNGGSLIPIYDSTGTPTTYGASAYADWTANKSIALTKMMGQVMLGTVPLNALLPATSSLTGFSSVVTGSSSSGVLWSTGSNLLNVFRGNTVTFTSSTALVNVAANTVYYIIPVTATTFRIATNFANALSSTAVAYTGAETGTVTAYIQTTGSGEGEYAHTQLIAELAAHNHTNGTPSLANAGAVSGFSIYATTPVNNTGTTGSSAPMNVTQPGVFYNMYIKL